MSKQINCTVSGTATDAPTLTVDGGELYLGVFESPSRVIFTLPDSVPPWGATIRYGGNEARVVVPTSGSVEGPALDYAPAVARLHVADDSLVNDAGARIVLGLATDFRLLQMFLDGEDVDAILAERQAAGAQGVRVFGTCVNLFALDPRHYDGRYYVALEQFAAWLAERGCYLQYTAIADGQLLDRGFDQQAHWRQACEALADAPNVVVCELGNENEKNGVDARQFGKPTRAPLVSSGSFCDGWEPTGSWGDVVTFHPRRDWKWPFTVAASVNELRQYPGQGKPIWIGEPIGAADHAEAGRRANDPALFEKMAADIGLWAAGGVFHSEGGLGSTPWTDPQRACAEAFFRGLHR